MFTLTFLKLPLINAYIHTRILNFVGYQSCESPRARLMVFKSSGTQCKIKYSNSNNRKYDLKNQFCIH